jgi:hypothetical protein
MAIFRPKPSQIFLLGLVPKSPIHIGLIYVKNPKPNISCLGPFKTNETQRKVSIASFPFGLDIRFYDPSATMSWYVSSTIHLIGRRQIWFRLVDNLFVAVPRTSSVNFYVTVWPPLQLQFFILNRTRVMYGTQYALTVRCHRYPSGKNLIHNRPHLIYARLHLTIVTSFRR